MKKDVAEFIRQCLHCIDSRLGGLRLRPLVQAVNGTGVGESIHSDLLRVGTAEPLGAGQASVGTKTPKHLILIVEDICSYVWLEPAAAL